MSGYALALYLHLLIVACLLGADLGRVYLARAGAAAEPPARALAVRGVLWLSVIGDLALVLVFPAGFELASTLDAYRIDSAAWRLAPWLLPALLLALTLAADRAADGPGGGRALGATDGIARAVVGGGQVWDGASVLFLGMTHMVEARWLAAKLALYGVLLLTSIATRRCTLSLRRALVSGSGAAPASDSTAAALRWLPLPVVAGSVLVLVIAWLGTAQPG